MAAPLRQWKPRDYAQPDSESEEEVEVPAPDGEDAPPVKIKVKAPPYVEDNDGEEEVEVDARLAPRLARAAVLAHSELYRACKAHDKDAPAMARSPDERLAMEGAWRDNFTAHAIERVEAKGLSVTMAGFRAICWSIYVENPQIRDDKPCLDWLNEVHVRTAVFGCQHTAESRMFWPSELEWTRYKHFVAGIMVQFFDHTQLGGLEGQLQRHKHKHIDPIGLETAYSERKEPDELRLVLAEQRKKALRDIAAGKDDVKIDVSEEASGAMWREAPEEVCANMPFRVARLVFKVEFDEALLLRYPPQPEAAVQFTPATYARTKQWVIDKCKMEQPEDVTALFRDIANGMFCPLGSETQKYRSRATMSNVTTSLDVLSNEIGADLAQFLHDRMLRPLDQLVTGPDAQGVALLFWDAIFLALFEFDLVQLLKFEWLKDYVFLNPQLAAAIKRMRAANFKGVVDQRPFLTMATRRYWIFYRQRLIPCGHSLLHAVLHWLHIFERDFCDKSADGDGAMTTEQEDDLQQIVRRHLPPGSVIPQAAQAPIGG